MEKNETQIFHANGKLLLSGEYLVLKGAGALALPLNKGQKLTVQDQSNGLSWKAFTPEGLWFDANFDDDIHLIKDNHSSKALRLQDILHQAIDIDTNTLELLRGKSVTTHLEFNKDWGWGSSSTLITLLSQWLKIDPYKLLAKTFGGSGYDIACAIENQPIIYQITDNENTVNRIDFNPNFKEHIYFIYSGRKQISSNEIKRVSSENGFDEKLIKKINQITLDMSSSTNLNDFGKLIHLHEEIISSIVQLKPIKDEHFQDFEGYTKSLGAWGGDFFMAISEHDEEYVHMYFQRKGLNTIFRYIDIVLKTNC